MPSTSSSPFPLGSDVVDPQPVPAPPLQDADVVLCRACARAGRCRLGLVAERLAPDGTVSTDLCCGSEHEGGSGVAHGGWVADVLDELVGHVPLLHGQLAVTGRLSIEFLRPVPVDRMLRGTAVVTGREGSRWFVDARLHLQAGGALLAVGQGVLVERDLAHYSRFASWLAEQGTED